MSDKCVQILSTWLPTYHLQLGILGKKPNQRFVFVRHIVLPAVRTLSRNNSDSTAGLVNKEETSQLSNFQQSF